MDDTIYEEPSETEAVDGNVAMTGPDGVSVILTPDAALETGGRLIDTAATAQGQRAGDEMLRKERRELGLDEEE